MDENRAANLAARLCSAASHRDGLICLFFLDDLQRFFHHGKFLTGILACHILRVFTHPIPEKMPRLPQCRQSSFPFQLTDFLP